MNQECCIELLLGDDKFEIHFHCQSFTGAQCQLYFVQSGFFFLFRTVSRLFHFQLPCREDFQSIPSVIKGTVFLQQT